MIKAVLFDLDGTLLDRDESVKKFIDNQYERLHAAVGHIPREQYISRFIELDKRGYVWKDRVYQQLTKEFAIREMTWEDLLQDYLNEFRFHCVPFPHMLPMLDELKRRNLRLGMITNGYGQFQMDNIQALGIEEYFEVILVSEWEGIKKPDPRIFLNALKQLDIPAEQSVFIGDHPENDVKAAQRIGMRGFWKKDAQWNNVSADDVVEDFLDLPSMIEKIGNTVETVKY